MTEQELADRLDTIAKAHLELKIQLLDQMDEMVALRSVMQALPGMLRQLVEQTLVASRAANAGNRRALEAQLEALRQGATRRPSGPPN